MEHSAPPHTQWTIPHSARRPIERATIFPSPTGDRELPDTLRPRLGLPLTTSCRVPRPNAEDTDQRDLGYTPLDSRPCDWLATESE